MAGLTITFLLSLCLLSVFAETNLRTLSKNELGKLLSTHKNSSEIQVIKSGGLQRGPYASIPPDTGGNYGDMVLLKRRSGDVLLIRETIINDITSAGELDMFWYGVFPAEITHVRAFNLGRERAYTLQISSVLRQGYAELFLRIPPFNIVRMSVEVYGIPY